MAVDIFGQSADMQALRGIADRHGLSLLTDTAQAPGATTGNRFTGTLADIGGFSLNYHKHIHCGEGGILVTDDDRLATRLQLIRNHAESVLKSDDPADYINMIGYNFRMGEIEAAIASVQLDKLKGRVESRQRAARQLDEGLAGLKGLTTPRVVQEGTHVYYVYGITVDTESLGVSRAAIVEALRAEGVPGIAEGYQNLHLLPIFEHRIAYGPDHFPFSLAEREIAYGPGTCPVAEKLHAETFIGLNLCMCEYPSEDVHAVVAAFRKVWAEPPIPGLSRTRHSRTRNTMVHVFDADKRSEFFDKTFAPTQLDLLNKGEITHLHPRDEILLNILKEHPAGARILDYGCGQGRLLGELLGRGYDAYGYEPSQGMGEIATSNSSRPTAFTSAPTTC